MENRVKSEKHMLSHPIEDEVLDYIVENYHQLIQTNASYLAEVIVHLAESFQKKGLRTGFIKRWMEKAFEIDEQNKKALSYLSKYRLYEQIHKINSFEFRPLRESDTKSQKETTISEYRITIDQFLDNIDHIIFNLGNDKNKLDSQQDQTIISLYNKALAQIEELKEEIIILDNILHDRQENARRTLYSMSNFEQVQKSVNRINELMKNVRLLSKVDEKEKKENRP